MLTPKSNNSTHRIAIFASGGGSNAQSIIDHFEKVDHITISLIASNKPKAQVLERAKNHDIPTLILQRDQFYKTEDILTHLTDHKIDFIVLAGFLWLIPTYLVHAFPSKMLNIHPALLPKYGGRGMYGMHVHRAVHAAREKQSGMTIHYVNETYDEGNVVAQYTCSIAEEDTPEIIAKKVLQLEHKYYPKVIEKVLSQEL